MDANPSVPLSTARWAQSPSHSAPISPSASLLIRAPLSSDDLDSSSEVEDLSTGDTDEDGFETASGSDEGEPRSVLTRSSSMPIAQLTRDDDVVEGEVFEEEEVVDDADGDGFFSGVARVSSFDGNRNPSLVDEGEVGGPSSETGVSVAFEGEVKHESPKGEGKSIEGVLGENHNPEENSSEDGVLGENPNPEENSKDRISAAAFEGEIQPASTKGASVESPTQEENTEDGVFGAVEGEAKPGSQKGVSGENPNQEENSEDGVLTEGLVSADTLPDNTLENPVIDEAEVDGAADENGFPDAQDGKYEILGGGSEEMNHNFEGELESEPIEVKSDAVEIEKDGIANSSGSNGNPKEAESNAAEAEENDIDDSNQKYGLVSLPAAETLELESSESNVSVLGALKHEGLDRESVAVDSLTAEGFGSKLDGGNGSRANKGIDGGSLSAEIAENSADNPYVVSETESVNGSISPNHEGKDEKVMTESEQASTESEPKDEKVMTEGLVSADTLPDNTLENPVIDEADEAEVDGAACENGFPDVQDEKDEILGGGSEEMNPIVEGELESEPIEVKSDAVEIEKDGIANSSGSNENPKEAESNAAEAEENDIVDSNKKHGLVSLPAAETLELESSESNVSVLGALKHEGLDRESVAIDSVTAEGFGSKLDGGNGSRANKAVDGGSLSVDDSEIAENSADNPYVVSETESVNGSISPNHEAKDEKVMTESEQAPIESEAKSNESKPGLAAESGDLDEKSPVTLGEDSKTRCIEREIEGTPIVAKNGSHSANDDETMDANEAEEEEGSVSDETPRVAILESSEAAKLMIKELEDGSSTSRDYSHNIIEGQIVSDSDEEVDSDEDEGKELFDSAALAALLKAATGSSPDGNIAITSSDATRIFSVDRPAGLGSSVPSLRPVPPQSTQPSLFTPSDLAVADEPQNTMNDEERKLHEKVELIRVKFLRLVLRLGHSPEDTVAAQVLYRLGLAEDMRRGGRQTSRAFSFESARKKAFELEMEGKDELDFSCNILVIGKSGVGKSGTINSIFGEEKSLTNPFEPETTSVREIVGTVDGVKIRVLDTPGLRTSFMDQASNKRILSVVKKYTKKCPPDIVLYVDRMDIQTRDSNDLPLLRSITSTLGSSIWFNAIVALTHAASAPPDGPGGSPLSYEVFVAQRSHVVQQSIRQAAGDMRLMNPVALVENHPSCRRNREGQRVLPSGLSWRPQLLLLCYSSKILSEANSLLKLQDSSPGKLFGFRLRSPPMHFFLSSLLQSKAHPKLSPDQRGENGDSDIDLDDFSDQEDEEDEYDQLPPFKPLRKNQIAKLTKEQKRAYFDEYDYRAKLLQKKQWKEEIRRLKELKKRGKNGQDGFGNGDFTEDFDHDNAPAAVPVPLPDMVLPPSFDCDNPAYRYRFLEPSSQLLTRPVLDTHGWDHDCGYDGVSLEENLAVAGRFPAAVSVQVTKDKKEFSIHLDSSVSAKHGESGSTLASFDVQTVGKQLAYFFRGETKFKNLKKNKTTAGVSVTFLGETIATGLKLEDQVSIGKRLNLAVSTGAVRAQGDVAYGANLEATLREKDYPIGQVLATLGLSLMRCRGDLALGANLQSQVSVGRNSKMVVRVGLNNKKSGQITVRTSSSEQLQIALVGLIPIAISVFRSIWPGES